MNFSHEFNSKTRHTELNLLVHMIQRFWILFKESNPFLNTTQRIEPFLLNVTQNLNFFWKLFKTLNFFFDKTQNWTFFFRYDSKNSTFLFFFDSQIFLNMPLRIKLFFVLLDFFKYFNRFFLKKKKTHRIEPSFSMTLRIEPFFVWLKEWNLSSFPIRLNSFIKMTQRIEPFFVKNIYFLPKKTQRIYHFFTMTLKMDFFLKYEYDSQNWTCFFWIWPFFSRHWTFLFFMNTTQRMEIL